AFVVSQPRNERPGATRLEPGLHLLTNLDLNDPTCPRIAASHRGFAAAGDGFGRDGDLDALVARLQTVLADHATALDPRGPGSLCVHMGPYGTRSSSVLLVPEVAEPVRYFHADGPPCQTRLLPVPPRDLWLGYGRTPEEYLASGRRDVESMRTLLSEAGTEWSSCRRILDLGCGAGRMLRWLDGVGAEVWGSDVSAPHIVWCQQNLSPPYRFLTNTSSPHLPFESGYFDLIYAGSLFTHLSELVEAWLLEIRRLLRAGGAAYVTIHDEHTLRALDRNPERPLARRLKSEPEARQFWRSPFGMFTLRRGFNALVFYSESFVRDSWGPIMPIMSMTPEAYDI